MHANGEVVGFVGGERIAGTWHIEALLGQGGAGAVYRVRDERTGRKLALKQLRPPADERRALLTAQFQREYHTLSQLAHPRIIEVYDYGTERDSAFYTMELLDGDDLHECGRLPWRKACALLCDVASSVAILHSRGLIHRDISARNVRCTSDGRAKLIDFGAMAQIGVSHRPVGTPPFVPPEALQLQALDGRADLYGLGALAYWMLTGRYAYPAQTFNQLRDLWRNMPSNPRKYEPELPEGLVQLVLQLLQLERSDRPSTAAEVIERLSGIAGLALDEQPQVGRAYLVMPTLVGRAAMLQETRSALLQAMQNARGGALLIEGEAGIGRSRFLDACVLEAKLLGATVLRGDADDGARGPYGLARALGAQLLQAEPDRALQSALPRLALLAHVLPELAGPDVTPVPNPARRHMQAALRDWLLAVAREKHIVIAVDDVEASDEPSAAWLSALAHGASRRRLSLLFTASAQAKPDAALALLREISRHIVLPALEPEQTEALLRSLFGDAARLAPIAQVLHRNAQGNPRRIIGLAEQLVARGVARYEAGSWALPVELSSDDMPASDREASRRSLLSLSTDARALAEALSLTDPSALALPDYTWLSDHEDARRTFRALDELVSGGLLIADGERYRLSHRDALAGLGAALDSERHRALHARIARALHASDDAAIVALHMLRGGQEGEAIERLLALSSEAVHPQLCEALELAIEAAQRLGLAVAIRIGLSHRLVQLAARLGRYDLFTKHAWPLVERLERDSGLLDCGELQQELTTPGPVADAFGRAQRRLDALPERERGLSPAESVRSLLTLYGACVGMASIAQDFDLIERLRSLEPLFASHAGVQVAQKLIDTQRAMQAGRFELASASSQQILQGMEPLTAAQRARPAVAELRAAQLYGMGLMTALAAKETSTEWVAELEKKPGHRGNAWRVRMVYQLALGNLELAGEYRRRSELLHLQDTGGIVLPGTTARLELLVYLTTDDILGVKRAAERIEGLAALYPKWQPTLSIARSHYRRLQGDAQGALDALEPALTLTAPGRHIDWSVATETRILLLHQLGQHASAAEVGLAALATAARHELPSAAVPLKRVTALALVHVGETALAESFTDECIAMHNAAGTRGVVMGLACEARARVAIAMRDKPAFELYAELCAREYKAFPNASLSAKYERLMRDAEAAGLALATDTPTTPADDARQDAARTVYSRMLTCISPAERAEKGLQLLLEATGAQAGYLFGLRAGHLRWLASADQTQPPAALSGSLEAFLRAQLDNDARTAPPPGSLPAPAELVIDDWGRELEPMLLRGRQQGETIIAGVAALHYPDDDRAQPRISMLEALIDALVADDIIDPITCVA